MKGLIRRGERDYWVDSRETAIRQAGVLMAANPAGDVIAEVDEPGPGEVRVTYAAVGDDSWIATIHYPVVPF